MRMQKTFILCAGVLAGLFSVTVQSAADGSAPATPQALMPSPFPPQSEPKRESGCKVYADMVNEMRLAKNRGDDRVLISNDALNRVYGAHGEKYRDSDNATRIIRSAVNYVLSPSNHLISNDALRGIAMRNCMTGNYLG